MKNRIIRFTTKGGDFNSWALDQMLSYVRNGIESKTNWKYVESIKFADVVIFGWYVGFLENRIFLNKHQIIICLLENDTKYVYSNLFNIQELKRIDLWLTQSSIEKTRLREKGINSLIMPYVKNLDRKNLNIKKSDSKIIEKIKRLKRNNKKLIVSIQRDSSFYENKWIAKEQKNPNYLLEIYKESEKLDLPFILILCGPRRHWIINELDNNKLHYIFLGDKPDEYDDYSNKLPRTLVLRILKECDFSIVTSNWEGGPLCIIESLEVGTLTFSTSVGFSNDLLPKEMILTGELSKDIATISKVIKSSKLEKKLLSESISKYERFKSIDMERIISNIIELMQKRIGYKKSKTNKFFSKYVDKLFFNFENFLRRLITFTKRKINNSFFKIESMKKKKYNKW